MSINRGTVGAALLISLLLLLSGCATQTMTKAERMEAYDNFIVTEKLSEQDSIHAFKFYSWSDLGRKHLIISSSPHKPYLVTLRSTCFGLDHTMGIKIHNSGSLLRAKFDSFSVPDEMPARCYIEKIYKLTKAQKKELLAIGREKPAEEKPAEEKQATAE